MCVCVCVCLIACVCVCMSSFVIFILSQTSLHTSDVQCVSIFVFVDGVFRQSVFYFIFIYNKISTFVNLLSFLV